MKHIFFFTTAILGTVVTTNVSADELVDSQLATHQAQLSSVVNQVETQPVTSDAIVEPVQSTELTQVESQPTAPVVTQALTDDEVDYVLSAETTKAQTDFSIDPSQEKPSDQIVADTTDLYAEGRGDKAIEPTLARDANTTPVKTVTVGNSTRVETYDINSSYASNDNTRLTTTDKIYTHAAQIQTSARHIDIANHLQGDIEKAYEYSAIIPTWLVADTKAAKIRLDNAFELTKQSGATDHEQLMYNQAVTNYTSVINKYNAFMTKQPLKQEDIIVVDASVKRTANVDKTMREVYDAYTQLPRGVRQRLGLIMIVNNSANHLGSADSLTGVMKLNSKYFEQENAALDIVGVFHHELGHIVDGDSFVSSDNLSVVNDHYNSFSRSDDFLELWDKVYKDNGSAYHQNQTEAFADAFSLYAGYLTGKLDSINDDIKDYFESHEIMFSDLPVSQSKALYDGATNIDELVFEQKSDTNTEVIDEVIDEVAVEVTDEVDTEVAEEVTDEVANDSNDEIANEEPSEVTDETSSETTDDVTDEVDAEVTEDVTDEEPSEVTDEVTDESTDEAVNETTEEVTDESTDEVTDQASFEVNNATADEVTDETAAEIDIDNISTLPEFVANDPVVLNVHDAFADASDDDMTSKVVNEEASESTISTSGHVNAASVHFDVDAFAPSPNAATMLANSSDKGSSEKSASEKSSSAQSASSQTARAKSDDDDQIKPVRTTNKENTLNDKAFLLLWLMLGLFGVLGIVLSIVLDALRK